MSNYQDLCPQIAVSQRNERKCLGAEMRRIYFIWGPGYHPREETLGEGDYVCGSLLIINLGIRHLLTGQGAQKWLRARGSARCPTNPITPGRGICQRRGRTFILAGPSASRHRSMEGSFHLWKDPRAGGSCTEHGL